MRTTAEFEEYFQDGLPNGGLFCPTTAEIAVGTPVIIELSTPLLPNKVLIRGRVRAWRPALPRLRVRAGATVEFDAAESDKRNFIVQTITGERGPSPRRRHTRLPVAVAVQYRTAEGADMTTAELTEISVGGALLTTSEPLPIDTDIILEITPPGAVSPLSISGKATYHLPNGSTGVKFISRDSGGSRRIRELVRRLRQS